MATTTESGSNLVRGLALAGFLAACFGAAAIGSVWTNSSLDAWYPALAKPSWNPPGWVFGPVWTALYLMMAVAGWLAWLRGAPPPGVVVWSWYFGQLILNMLWSGIFFGLQQPGWAAVEIVLLWLAIAGTIAVFRRRSTAAAWLLVPYLAWVTFATMLNFTLWRMNA
jgi:benzodiazapine receptor